ncbi:unnamed protein product [Symbiodinium natans]|uniref:Uncharacterized protein n=1 Tax=Symbiodinium natans TaxID=878477 RepID=A0A812NM16_9DINO|nr:unnamed protein product [Symbiodinium natans]
MCSAKAKVMQPAEHQLKVSTPQDANETKAIVFSFSGGARQPNDSRLACRMFPAATAVIPVTTTELALQFGAFAAFLWAVLNSFGHSQQQLILSGHSLGVTLAQAVARYLERLGIDVAAIVAMDPRCNAGDVVQEAGFLSALTNAVPANVRLEALQLTCRAPFVPFHFKLEHRSRVDSEMAKMQH